VSVGLGGIDFAMYRDRQSTLVAIVLAAAAVAYVA